MFVALFTMSFMICAGIVRSFIQPIKIGPSRSEMVEKRFSEWYGLHVLQGNRISFMQFVFLGLTDNISRIGGNMPSEKRVQSYYIGVFITTFFFAINSFYFLANVLREMSIIDRLAPSINMLESIEPILESFQYLVVWSVETLTSLIGIDSVLIALATYELAMLIFFITKRQILQKHLREFLLPSIEKRPTKPHLHEYLFGPQEAIDQEILETERAFDERSSVFWRRTVFGADNADIRDLVGDLYDFDGEHWEINTHSKIRHNDKKKLDIALRVKELKNQDIWEGISEEDYAIANECQSFDIEISNNEHSLIIHGETKEIIQQSTNFPEDVLKMIQMKIDEVNSSLIES
ncbi:hypothetical protein N9L15_02570 [Euryarchaeota archaeon]|nr:hypothetical protein [Euryarchaeota archaeon]